MRRRLLSLPLLLLLPVVNAQQYESEMRIVKEREASQAQDFDPDKALQQAQGNPYAQAMILREMAARAQKAGDSAAASRYLRQALDKRALSDFAAREMQKSLAVMLAEQEDYGAVIRELAPLLRQDKNPAPELLMVLGAAYAQKGRHAEALPLLEKALDQSKQIPADWHALTATSAAALKRWSKALPHARQAVDKQPAELSYWQLLSQVHIGLKDGLSALAAMDMAYRLGLLKESQDRLQFAQLFFSNGIPFEAASLLQAEIESGRLPRDGDNLELLASAWVAAREHQLAIPALQEAARAKGSAQLYLQLGQLQFDRGEWGAAARALRQALDKGAGRHSNPARMMLGVALYQQQDLASARQAFSAAAESGSADARQWMSYLDSGLAREEALRMAAVRPEDAGDFSQRFDGESITLRGRSAAGPRSSRGFTPVGAQKEGSEDGRIPAWSGGLAREDWPQSFSPGQRLQDPFPQDQPELVITANNWDQYRDGLSMGHRALFQRYPDYRMPVYPSRRSVAYPEEIYAATQANRGRAKLLGSDALSGARLGFPFPSPGNGVEVMWNHRVRYRGDANSLSSRQALVLANGSLSEQYLQVEQVLYRYANLKNPSDLAQDNVLLYYLTYFRGAAGDLAFTALVHESANALQRERSIWVIPDGVSKMFRIPPVGYDNPFPGSGGVAFVDMVDMYNGGFDRYDWKILGKREVLLPYNSYRLNDARQANAELLQKGFLRPDNTRYEWHRVWLIEANERGGKRHSFGARRFYVDEDSWNIVLVENYDRQGRLWRFQEGHLLPIYDEKWTNALPVVTYDLKDGRYFVNRLTNDDDWRSGKEDTLSEQDFRPATVRARYAR